MRQQSIKCVCYWDEKETRDADVVPEDETSSSRHKTSQNHMYSSLAFVFPGWKYSINPHTTVLFCHLSPSTPRTTLLLKICWVSLLSATSLNPLSLFCLVANQNQNSKPRPFFFGLCEPLGFFYSMKVGISCLYNVWKSYPKRAVNSTINCIQCLLIESWMQFIQCPLQWDYPRYPNCSRFFNSSFQGCWHLWNLTPNAPNVLLRIHSCMHTKMLLKP